jgi:hypothetical protein
LKWQENSNANLDIIYHLVTALGSLLSIFTTNISSRNGLNYGVVLSLLAFTFSLLLLNIKEYFLYAVIFFIICLSNGHLQNISTTLIVKKFSQKYRASVYVLAYFFTQFGKFLFACLMFKYNEVISKGRIEFTVYPILIIIFGQVVFNLFLVKKLKQKKKLKKECKIISSGNHKIKEGKMISLTNLIEINLPAEASFEIISFYQKTKNFLQTIYEPIILLVYTYQSHFLNLIFLNLSLGIQFFSMINVFPLLKTKSLVLVDEIFLSKLYHTIFLLFLPILFLFKSITRKFLLSFTFLISLILNALILFNIYDSSIFIHLFRFIWNVCYITVNLYSAESVSKKLRGVNTSIMGSIFKISCVIEIMTIDKLISFSIYLPILLNIVIILGDVLLVNKLQVETHKKSIEDIEIEINYLQST